MASDKAFIAGMGLLEAAFEAQEAVRHRLYRSRFQEVPDEDFLAAVARCIDELRVFPTVRDLLDRLPGRLDPRAEAENAWAAALRSATDGPSDYNPTIGCTPTGADLDEVTLAAAGGPRGLKRIMAVSENTHQLGFARREFLDRWAAVRANVASGFLPDGRRREALGPGRGEGRARELPAAGATAATNPESAARGSEVKKEERR